MGWKAGTVLLAYIDPTPIVTVTGTLGAILAALASAGALLLGSGRRLWRGARKPPRTALAAAVVVLLGLAGLACWYFLGDRETQAGVQSRVQGRLIILGLDGLSPDVLDRLLVAGELPGFARLRDQGCYRQLGTTNPPQSPVAWCTVVTGRNPGKHGIYDFIRRQPDSYLPDLSLTRQENGKPRCARETPAFWDYAAELGVPVTVVNCPVTFPPDAVNGRMLSGMGTPDLLGTEGTFAFYTTAPESVTADTGGEVHVVTEAHGRLDLNVYGPNRASLTGKTERLSVPLTVEVAPGRDGAAFAVGAEHFCLAPGQWSSWVEVTFGLGPFRAMHGITRFYLAELKPAVKLYMSPISMDPRKPWLPVSYPKTYARDRCEKIGVFSTRGMPYDTWGLNEGRLPEDAFLQQADSVLETSKRLLRDELAATGTGVLFVYFEYPDIIQHLYWRFVDPEHPAHEPGATARLAGMVDECYRRMDAVVGETLDAMRPTDTLLVLSDHGFTTFRRAMHVNALLRRAGLLVLRDSVAGGGGGPLFRDVDWTRTRAYALGFGGIYLNLEGREPQGIVKPGAEAEALLSALTEALGRLTDPATGGRVVHRVYRGADIFRGPNANRAPDLYLGLERGYGVSWQTALGATPSELLEDNARKWSGTHLIDPELVPGVLFCSRPVAGGSPTLYDIAPTVLRWMGMDDARLAKEDLDGAPLF